MSDMFPEEIFYVCACCHSQSDKGHVSKQQISETRFVQSVWENFRRLHVDTVVVEWPAARHKLQEILKSDAWVLAQVVVVVAVCVQQTICVAQLRLLGETVHFCLRTWRDNLVIFFNVPSQAVIAADCTVREDLYASRSTQKTSGRPNYRYSF